MLPFSVYIGPEMELKVGYQIGLQTDLPISEARMMSYIASSLDHQERLGPCVIFVDEPFYEWLYRTTLERMYHDIVFLPATVTTREEVDAFQADMFGDQLVKVDEKEFEATDEIKLELQKKLLPFDIAIKWEELILQEQFILGLYKKD